MDVAELIQRFGGTLKGVGKIKLSGVAPLEAATAEHISFLSDSKLRAQAQQTLAGALILTEADDKALTTYQGTRIITKNPYAYYAKAAQLFAAQQVLPAAPGIHPSACIGARAQIAVTASIGPYAVIESEAIVEDYAMIGAGSFIGHHAHVGAHTCFHARVTFHAHCVIGQRGIIHSGAVIGADGFGLANEDGVWIKIPQLGKVVIGDDVEIGANTTIDRGTLADTVLEDGVKLDNQIQIAHNCHIGAHTAIAACVGIAGSTTIGKYCMIGGAAMIHGHITITDRVIISAATPVPHSIPEPGRYTGLYPLAQHRAWKKSAALVRNLAAMRATIQSLKQTIKSFTK